MTAGTGSTILVTGASGFVGAQLARMLAARRYHVRALTRVPDRVRDLRPAGIETCQGGLGDRSSLERACEGVRVVYHTAGVAMGRSGGIAALRAVGAAGVGTLVDAAATMGVRRIVHCSTTDVHGRLGELPANEEAALAPRDAYDAARLDAERTAREAAARLGVELVVARPSQVYGPGDCRLIGLFRAVVRRRFVPLGTGKVSVHLLYVDDLVEGLRLCGESSHAAGRTYTLAGGEIVQLGDLVGVIAREAGVRPLPFHLPVWPASVAAAVSEWLCRAIGRTPVLERRQVAFYTEQRAFDISRARAELGFAPKVDVREGVRRCLEWYRGQNLI